MAMVRPPSSPPSMSFRRNRMRAGVGCLALLALGATLMASGSLPGRGRLWAPSMNQAAADTIPRPPKAGAGNYKGGSRVDVAGRDGTFHLEHEKAVAARAAENPVQLASVPSPSPSPTPGLEKYHVVCTVGEGIYNEWQVRVAYYWFKKAKEQCELEQGAACPMGGFTRLLHSGKPDDWMAEIPTVVAPKLPPDYANVAGNFVVLTRSYALKLWSEQTMDSIPEKYIWMAEPDHIFLRAPPLWATPDRPAAFEFFYMHPKDQQSIINRFNPRNVSIDAFFPIGNSPAQIHRDQFAALMGPWLNMSLALKNDIEAGPHFGWILDMYAFLMASAVGLAEPLNYTLHPDMMLHAPYSRTLVAPETGQPAYMIHYTYGNGCNETAGTGMEANHRGSWVWDKRKWMVNYPPHNFPLPPKGCEHEVVSELVRRVNEAAEHLPRWKELEGPLVVGGM